MKKLAKNLMTWAIVFEVMFVANISSASENLENKCFTVSQRNNFGGSNSEFWSKFRESVMPEDSDKGKIPNYEKHSDPPPQDNNQQPPRR